MSQVEGFLGRTSRAELPSAVRRRVHDYVVADKGQPKGSGRLVEDWNKNSKKGSALIASRAGKG